MGPISSLDPRGPPPAQAATTSAPQQAGQPQDLSWAPRRGGDRTWGCIGDVSPEQKTVGGRPPAGAGNQSVHSRGAGSAGTCLGRGCCRAVGAAWPGWVLRVVLTVSRHKPHTHAHTHALSHMCSHIHALSHTLAHISPGELFPAAAVRCGQEPGAASLTCMVSCDERYCSHSIFMPQKGSHHTEKA